MKHAVLSAIVLMLFAAGARAQSITTNNAKPQQTQNLLWYVVSGTYSFAGQTPTSFKMSVTDNRTGVTTNYDATFYRDGTWACSCGGPAAAPPGAFTAWGWWTYTNLEWQNVVVQSAYTITFP